MSTQYNPKLTSRELLQERVYKLLSELSYEGYNYEEVLMLLHGAGMFAEHEMRANAETSLRVTKISADLAGHIEGCSLYPAPATCSEVVERLPSKWLDQWHEDNGYALCGFYDLHDLAVIKQKLSKLLTIYQKSWREQIIKEKS